MKTLIVYEDGRPELERTAKNIAERLDPARYEVRVRAASAVTIPELLAARFYLFGADESASPSYAEIARVVAGVNLAGRKAAYFGSTGAAVAWIKGIVADADLAAAGSDLVGPRPEPTALAAWLRGIA
ncbi:MAG: hypothetical protein JNG85_15685 [Spirochaetaceae bacterium]|nr:hypothetical protein [Spirochaetaceae bacterium]